MGAIVILEVAVAALVLASLTAYVVLGGADFGGGVWDALARGSDAGAQRSVIAKAMGPVWEANHVWLIFAIVATWTAFPAAFAAMFTHLAVPVTIALVGIVLRGSAFALREKAVEVGRPHAGLGHLFGAASIVTPVFLGAAVGALASGTAGRTPGASDAWLAPFPLTVGVLAVCLCALLAAVFLTLETREPLRERFRRRAFGAWGATAVAGAAGILTARQGAPLIFTGLTHGAGAGLVLAAVAAGAGALICLLARRYPLARVCVIAQVAFVLWAWAGAQYPYVVVPTLTIAQAAAPPVTITGFLVVALLGLAILIPSLWYLFRIFKSSEQNS